MMEEPNVVDVATPAIICGDIHGQFHDLMVLFKNGGDPAATNYVFLVNNCLIRGIM